MQLYPEQSFPFTIHSFHVCIQFSTQCVIWPFLSSGSLHYSKLALAVVMQFGEFHNKCPIHLHCLFLISFSAEGWFVLSHCRLLLVVSGQYKFDILCRKLFTNTCTCNDCSNTTLVSTNYLQLLLKLFQNYCLNTSLIK